jgi:hypothetical protein
LVEQTALLSVESIAPSFHGSGIRQMARTQLSLALMSLCFVALAGYADAHTSEKRRKQDPTYQRDGLLLSARLDKQVYRLDEVVSIDVALENTSDRAILIYRGVTASSVVWLQDSMGNGLQDRLVSCFLLPPPYPAKDFVLLAPGETIHGRQVVAPANYDITEPGQYYVTVGFSSPILAKYGPKDAKFLAQEDGYLEAGPILFEFAL